MNWEKLLPPTRHSGQLSGTLRPAIAARVDLPATTPVYTGIHDSNASLVPHLITQKAPFSVVSTGTWFIVMAIGEASKTLDETRDTLLNVNAQGNAVPSARFMGGRERELLETTSGSAQAMDKLLNNSESPVMLMPSLVPGTGPYPSLSEQWIGDVGSTDAMQRSCAVTMYLALMTYECMQLIGSDGPTYIEGPLAGDQQFTCMLAAVSSRPVITSSSETGTSVGAAMLIQAPTKPPAHTVIDPDSVERHRLERYARLWQAQLCDHAK